MCSHPLSIGQVIKIVSVPHSNRGIIEVKYPDRGNYRSSADEVAMSGPQNIEEEILTRIVVTVDP